MNDRGLAIIRKNHRFLINNIECDIIRHYLFEKNILTTDDMEVLGMRDKTRAFKNEILLLHILPRRGPFAYAKFLESLKEEDHFSHVVDVLEATQLCDNDLKNDLQSERFAAIHREVDSMYERLQSMNAGRNRANGNHVLLIVLFCSSV